MVSFLGAVAVVVAGGWGGRMDYFLSDVVTFAVVFGVGDGGGTKDSRFC